MVFLDASLDEEGVAPKYRDMLVRTAKDPVGQTIAFHLMMRLFFQHVMGIRPECIESRRGARRDVPREWCIDGLGATRPKLSADGAAQTFPHVLHTFKGRTRKGYLLHFQKIGCIAKSVKQLK